MTQHQPTAAPTCHAPPLGDGLSPFPHARDGWLVRHRASDGRLLAEPGEKTSRELWAEGGEAVLELRLPDERGDAFHLTFDLRAAREPRRVGLRAGGRLLGEWEVGTTTAEKKLAIVPPDLGRPGEVLRLSLFAAGSTAAAAPTAGGEPGPFVLSALGLFGDRAGFLAGLQAAYDQACAYREELFDRGVNPLEDRGELVDKVHVTLGHLRNLPGVAADVVGKLERLLADPWVRGRCNARLVFDDAYFVAQRELLVEGRVHRAIAAWRRELEIFHRAVVHLGNRAFLLRGEQLPDAPARNRNGDPLRDLVERFDYPSDRLRVLKERNEFLNTLEVLLRRDRLESIVPDLEIEMTSYCNYACVMCGRSWYPFQFDRQDDEQLSKLLPVLPYVRHVTIAGVGENTTSDRLGVFALMLQKFACDSRIFTNGSLIDRQLEALARFRKVCISFDGGTAETFETQRRGANFERVLRNIGLLRKAAPDITLAFSVVVSRLNLHEIPQIVQHAVDLGVDHVALSPVWHDSPMQLRPSDREPFHRLLAEARAIADPAGVALQVNFGDEDFAVAADEPLERPRLLSFFRDLKFPSNHIPAMPEIERTLAGLEYHHHPDPAIFPTRAWPAPPPPPPEPQQEPLRFEFDLEAAIAATEDAIARAQQELAGRPPGELELPYCLSIWKYTYLRANGKNRLCPQTLIDAGNSGKDGFVPVMNSEQNQHFRRTMFGGELESVCRKCLDPYRRWGHEQVVQQLKGMGLQPLDRTRYSTRFQ